MKNRLIIIGAGGHGKVVADNAVKNGYEQIFFVDDHASGKCLGFPIIGTTADLEALDDGQTDFILGIGNNGARKRIAQSHSVSWTTLIHPSAQIALGVSVGCGTVIMAGVIVNADARIGAHCIINTAAVVEHDNILEDYVHISPGARLSGTVSVGSCTWIGTGTSIINNVSICGDVIIGVGSTVIRSIDRKGTYYGLVSEKHGH